MKIYEGETNIKVGDRIQFIVERPVSYLDIGDNLEGTVDIIYDGSTSEIFDKLHPMVRPVSFPLFHVKVDHKNGEPFEDEIQCGEKYLTKKEG